jgi:DNA-binding CsgD family transcriptional regulator
VVADERPSRGDRARLVGRVEERARICAIIDEARSGRSGALLLMGDPGVGKTALLEEAAAEAGGVQLLRVVGAEAESELPYSGLSALVLPLRELLPALPGPQSEALRGALALGPPVAGDPFTICAATLSLLAAAAEQAPLVVIVDDAHWLDAASQQALLFAARRVAAEGIAMILAARSEPHGPLHAAALPVLRIEPLDEAEARTLLARTASLESDVAERVLAAAGGNPLGLLELPRALSPAQRAGGAPLPEPLPPGEAVATAFQDRVDALPGPTRRLLVLLAAAEDAASDACLVGAAAARLDLRIDRLDDAIAAGVLAPGGETRFRHPLLRSIVYHGASLVERRSVHAALAASLPETSTRAAWHRALAVDESDELAAAALEQASVEARSLSGHRAAARGFEQAARITPVGDARVHRLLEAATDWLVAGSPERSLTLTAEARATTRDALARARAETLRARAAAFGGDVLAARTMLADEARRVADEAPEVAAMMLAEAASFCYPSGEGRLGVETAEEACRIALAGGGQAIMAAELILAVGIAMVGQPRRGLEIVDRWLPVLEQADPLAGVHQVIQGPTLALVYAERFVDARRIAERVVRAARDRSAPTVLPLALAALAEIDYRTGNWQAADANLQEAVRLAVDTGQGLHFPTLRALVARNAAARGSQEESREAAADARGAGGPANQATLFFVNSALALLEMGAGRHAEVIDLLEPLAASASERQLEYPPITMWEPDLVEAYVRAGRLDDAARTLDTFDRRAAVSPGVWPRASAARCLGLLAEADHARHFTEALELHAATPMPFEHARTQLAYGERLRRDRRRADAAVQLRAALGTFDRLGAERFAARARAELRACGEAPRTAGERPLAGLTAAELQVALRIAAGATNREAAAELFLSSKTIDFHLRNIYRKLDIRSRSELASLIARNERVA